MRWIPDRIIVAPTDKHGISEEAVLDILTARIAALHLIVLGIVIPHVYVC